MFFISETFICSIGRFTFLHDEGNPRFEIKFFLNEKPAGNSKTTDTGVDENGEQALNPESTLEGDDLNIVSIGGNKGQIDSYTKK